MYGRISEILRRKSFVILSGFLWHSVSIEEMKLFFAKRGKVFKLMEPSLGFLKTNSLAFMLFITRLIPR